jgi:sulfite exporter TauE/SafE
MTPVWTGFILGLFGSFHCVGMCGAIALSVPMDLTTRLSLLRDALLYNIGRILTYTLLGLLAGYFGRAFFSSGYQQWLSVELGVLMLILYFTPKKITDKVARSLGLEAYTSQIRRGFSALLNRPGAISMLSIGLLNGLLPCGFVYMAIAGSILQSTPLEGAQFMSMFGLGTAPMMLATGISQVFVTIRIRNKIKQLKPYLMVIVAVLFILRGLSLGIPYLSPSMPDPQYPDVYCGEQSFLN